MNNWLQRRPARVAAIVHIFACVFLGACSSQCPGERSEAAISLESGGAPTKMVQWMFDPLPAERQHLDSLLERVGRATGGPDFRRGATLYRFGSSAAPQRYLMIASRDTTPPPAVLGEQEVLLYVLSTQGVATPFRVSTSPRSSHPFAVAEIADFDADGVADLAYCINGSEEDGGVLSIVGYRDNHWYGIASPAEHELCT